MLSNIFNLLADSLEICVWIVFLPQFSVQILIIKYDFYILSEKKIFFEKEKKICSTKLRKTF